MKRIQLDNTPIETVLSEVTSVLETGGLILFPTETVYGAGVDATNQAAVDKLLAYKSRREGKPLSIAVTNQAMAEQYVELNDQARVLYQQLLPGPVTVVSKGRGNVATGIESEFGTLGIRIPDYPLLLKILGKLDKPLTATSANASGKKRPYTIDDVLSQLSQKQQDLIDLALDAGELPKNEPSTVIDTTMSTPLTLRSGSVRIESDRQFFSKSEKETQDLAGKLLLKHWGDVKDTGLVVGLNGSLGAGKTVFAKGIAQFLQIDESITSPTYTYIEEYRFERHGVAGFLYHLDLWKVESAEELERLEVASLFQPKNVIVIEWWSQVSQWLLPTLLEKKLPFIEIDVEDEDGVRKMAVHEN